VLVDGVCQILNFSFSSIKQAVEKSLTGLFPGRILHADIFILDLHKVESGNDVVIVRMRANPDPLNPA
jgi:hypothetical protein